MLPRKYEMKECKFKVGDTVRLKSGSPAVVISQVDENEVTFLYFNEARGEIMAGKISIESANCCLNYF